MTENESGVPLVGNMVAAGFPSPAEDYLETRIEVEKILIQHPASTFLVRAHGGSMERAGIFDSDLLVVDKSLEAKNRDVVIAIVDGEFLVKRLIVVLDGGEGQPRTLLRAEEMGEEEIWPDLVMKEEDVVWGVVKWVLHQV